MSVKKGTKENKLSMAIYNGDEILNLENLLNKRCSWSSSRLSKLL